MIISGIIVKLVSLVVVFRVGFFVLLALMNYKHNQEIESSYFARVKKVA